jgi:hypothetical protein
MFDIIDPYLLRIAHNLHRTTWPQVDPDDFHQEMRLWFLEKYGQADCTEHKKGWYSQGAAWHARHWARDLYTRFHKGKRIAWADPLPEWWDETYD